jgi:hypothetical protein
MVVLPVAPTIDRTTPRSSIVIDTKYVVRMINKVRAVNRVGAIEELIWELGFRSTIDPGCCFCASIFGEGLLTW